MWADPQTQALLRTLKQQVKHWAHSRLAITSTQMAAFGCFHWMQCTPVDGADGQRVQRLASIMIVVQIYVWINAGVDAGGM